MLQSPPSSIETKASWAVATAALVTMLMAFGAAWITAVALKDIAAEVDGVRSIPALASALAWLGSGVGGILMGRIAEKVGTRWTVIFGSLMIAVGLAISTLGPPWPLWIGHGIFIGLIGLGGINAPMYIYVSRWFDRRRGSALALISSGSYLAGAMWPPMFERAIANFGWRETMLWYALAEVVVIIPLAVIYFCAPPELILPAARFRRRKGTRARVAAESGIRRDLCRCGSVLRADGDAARPSGRFLQRPRDQPLGWGAYALGAARDCVPEPADLGRHLRPDRRPCYRFDRLRMAVGIDDRLPVDPE
jgi:MFS family permease